MQQKEFLFVKGGVKNINVNNRNSYKFQVINGMLH